MSFVNNFTYLLRTENVYDKEITESNGRLCHIKSIIYYYILLLYHKTSSNTLLTIH